MHDREDGTYSIRYNTIALRPGRYTMRVDLALSRMRHGRGGGLSAEAFINGGLSGIPMLFGMDRGPLPLVDLLLAQYTCKSFHSG